MNKPCGAFGYTIYWACGSIAAVLSPDASIGTILSAGKGLEKKDSLKFVF
jgi:hypothetical protein